MPRGCGPARRPRAREADERSSRLNAGALLMTAGLAATCATAVAWRSTRSPRAGRARCSTPSSRRAVAEPGVLGEIAAAKRDRACARASTACRSMRCAPAPADAAAASPTRSRKPGARFILEIKKASPSAGAIRPAPIQRGLARGYAGVADALSVLCDRAFFGGSLDDLAAARARIRRADPRQGFLRRSAPGGRGPDRRRRRDSGDAVAARRRAGRAMIAEARRFGMDALVEVHDEREMRRALALGAPLIGINNRDLRDLSVDLSTTERLARARARPPARFRIRHLSARRRRTACTAASTLSSLVRR